VQQVYHASPALVCLFLHGYRFKVPSTLATVIQILIDFTPISIVLGTNQIHVKKCMTSWQNF